MADDDINGDSDETQTEDESAKKVAKHDSGAADLEKVTDYAEEKEIATSDVSVCGIFTLKAMPLMLVFRNGNLSAINAIKRLRIRWQKRGSLPKSLLRKRTSI